MSQNILMQMAEHTRQILVQRKAEVPLKGIRALASMQRRPIDVSSTLRDDGQISLVAQIKRISPDMDSPIENFDLLMLKSRFEAAGVRALSVVTNEKFYQMGVADLTLISQHSTIPIIRQDVIFDEYQIVEARAAGADGVILIASLLEPEQLRNLISITQRNRMTAIIQVQSKEETLQAIQYEPRVISISNRNMVDFSVDLDQTLRLREYIPPHIVVISHGGLRTADDVAYVYQAHLDGIIVGQALLTAPDTAAAIHELFKLTNTL